MLDIGTLSTLETALELFKKVSLLSASDDMDPEDGYNSIRLLHTYGNSYKLELWFYSYGDNADAESFARLTKFRRSIGGTWDKNYYGSTSEFSRELNGVKIELNCSREATCKRVVVRTEEIPEQIIPASTREVIEWVCDE